MDRRTPPDPSDDASTRGGDPAPVRLSVLQRMQHDIAGKDRPAMLHALSQLIKSELTIGERERILARLAVLQRIKEDIAGQDRPAMFHSVQQLMKLESSALWRLERGSREAG